MPDGGEGTETERAAVFLNAGDLGMEEQLNRIRYRAAGLLTVLLLTAVPGCADQALAEAAGTTETVAAADAVEIISRDFSHNGYVDSIAFLLPSGWSYESYEKIDAGENMDSHEWGFEICMDGEEEPSLFLFGSRQADSGRFDPAGMSPEAVQTGAGLTGNRYIRQITLENGEVRQEYYVLFDGVAGSGAAYQVYASLTPEAYEKYRPALDTLVAGISIAAVAKAE